MKNESAKKDKLSSLEERVYVLIGCIPMITVVAISFYLVYTDYALNNHSFWGKSWHLSNVEKTSYDVNVTCVDADYTTDRKKFPTCAPANCFRYFDDFYISQDEGKALLK